jgi:hypothetical protein
MTLFKQFEQILQMPADEVGEHLPDTLSEIAAVWLGKPEEPLVLAMIGSMRSMIDGVANYVAAQEDMDEAANDHIRGVYAHASNQLLRNFKAVVGMTDMQKQIDEKEGS